MICRLLLLCSVPLITAGLVTHDFARTQGTENCVPTIISRDTLFVPPEPYLQDHTPSGMFWYGNGELWTLLDGEGTWKDFSPAGTKLTYWSLKFNRRTEIEPVLTVTARRLDRDVPIVVAGHASAVFVTGPMPAAMMVGLELPASGCWKITAKYRRHELSFVRLVQIK
jgi:hypothetical protein